MIDSDGEFGRVGWLVITRHVDAVPRVPGSTPGRSAAVDGGHLLRLTGSLSAGDISTSSFTPATLDVVTCRANLSTLKWQTAGPSFAPPPHVVPLLLLTPPSPVGFVTTRRQDLYTCWTAPKAIKLPICSIEKLV